MKKKIDFYIYKCTNNWIYTRIDIKSIAKSQDGFIYLKTEMEMAMWVLEVFCFDEKHMDFLKNYFVRIFIKNRGNRAEIL